MAHTARTREDEDALVLSGPDVAALEMVARSTLTDYDDNGGDRQIAKLQAAARRVLKIAKVARGWVRKDSPIVFELVEADRSRMPVGAYTDTRVVRIEDNKCIEETRVLRNWSRDELRGLCGEDAPEQCQEFEDESGRWHRV